MLSNCFYRCISALSLIFMLAVQETVADNIEVRYWFDGATDDIKYLSTDNGSIIVQYDELRNKPVNCVFLQVKDASGEWSTIYTHYFYSSRNKELDLKFTLDGGSNQFHIGSQGAVLDVSRVCDGLHRYSIIDKNGALPPRNGYFYKNTPVEEDLMMHLISFRDGVRKTMPITKLDNGNIYVDVSDLNIGIYPFVAVVQNKSLGSILAMSSFMADIQPFGGAKVTDITYWLNDNIGKAKTIPISDGQMSFSFKDALEVLDLDVPTSDYSLSFLDNTPYATPNYDIRVSVMSNLGFQLDSVSYFRDNSKAAAIDAVTLRSGVQHDFGKVDTAAVLWARFPVNPGDEIKYLPRWKSDTKFFDNTGNIIDTYNFDEDIPSAILKVDSASMYYAEIFGVRESIRDYSVKMTYLKGASAGNVYVEEPEFSGIPVEWDSKSNWDVFDDELCLVTNGVKLQVSKSESQYSPAITTMTNLCRLHQDNKMIFSADEYIEHIIICVSEECEIPNFSSPDGQITIDENRHIIMWEGLADKVEILVNNNTSSRSYLTGNIQELVFSKAFVELAQVGKEFFTLNDREIFESQSYSGYTTVRIWNNGKECGIYQLTPEFRIVNNGGLLTIKTGKEVFTHQIEGNLIIAYSNDGYVSVDEINADSCPNISFNDNSIIIKGLPEYVGIYDINGHTIFQDMVTDETFNYPLADLIKGIYIIRVGNTSTKFLLK